MVPSEVGYHLQPLLFRGGGLARDEDTGDGFVLILCFQRMHFFDCPDAGDTGCAPEVDEYHPPPVFLQNALKDGRILSGRHFTNPVARFGEMSLPGFVLFRVYLLAQCGEQPRITLISSSRRGSLLLKRWKQWRVELNRSAR